MANGYGEDMTNTKRGAGILIVNNTGSDLRIFDSAILDAILAGGVLPEELADLLVLTQIPSTGTAADCNGRWRIDAAYSRAE